MRDHPSLPRSKRPRYRAKPKSLSIVWKEGKILIKELELELPQTNTTYIVGGGPGPKKWTGTYFFDESGCPADEETRRHLLEDACAYLFAREDRIRDAPRALSPDAPAEVYEQYLQAMGYGMDAGETRTSSGREDEDGEWQQSQQELHREGCWGGVATPPESLARPRTTRSLVRIPPSDWRRALANRLAVIFDLDPGEVLIRRMTVLLGRETGWHEWKTDASLQPLLARLHGDPTKCRLIRELESIAFRRGNLAHQKASAREPFHIWFPSEFGLFIFALPCWPESKRRKAATQGAAFAFAAYHEFRRLGRVDSAILAAAAWKAGPFLTSPEELCRKRPTLARVGRHFALTPPQIRYAARKLEPVVEKLQNSAPKS